VTDTVAKPRFLDREALVLAAADLADREGWSAVTLSRVAKEVDRHVTSLYSHVDSLAGLHRAVALLALDELGQGVWRAALGKVQGDALQAIAEVYRDFAVRHPGRAAAMVAERDPDDDEVRARGAHLAEPVRAVFRSFGLDEDRAAIAHRVFSATVNGFARSTDRVEVDDFHQAVALVVEGLSSGRWPAALPDA
jgi:AcrR family transcriptional regulator